MIHSCMDVSGVCINGLAVVEALWRCAGANWNWCEAIGDLAVSICWCGGMRIVPVYNYEDIPYKPNTSYDCWHWLPTATAVSSTM